MLDNLQIVKIVKMKKYIFQSKIPPYNRIIIEAETEEKAKAVFIDIFGKVLSKYSIIKQK
jgi:hypothetical protein